MQHFYFNEHNVCLNPVVEQICDTNKIMISISTAHRDGEWFYGYHFMMKCMPYTGASCGCSSSGNRDNFTDQQSARIAVLQRAIDFLGSRQDAKKEIEIVKAAMYPQLSFF